MGMRILQVVLIGLSLYLIHASPRKKRDAAFTANIEVSGSVHSTDLRFLSVAMGASQCERLDKFKVETQKLKNLAAALGPAVVRVGGLRGVFNINNPDNRENPVDTEAVEEWEDHFHANFWTGEISRWHYTNVNCTGQDLETLINFFNGADWQVMYQFNHLLRDHEDKWDPQNAKIMLAYLAERNLDIEFFQLTNEPNTYPTNLDVDNNVTKIVEDFEVIRNFLNSEDCPEIYRDAKLVGPDVGIHGPSKRGYLSQVLLSGLGQYLDYLGVHFYYVDGRTATTDQFLNGSIYDHLYDVIDWANDFMDNANNDLPIFLSETASAFGGGAPMLSNRYLGSLMWLDELGVAAKKGVEMLNRQTFWAGQYGLVEFRDYDPTPSYYVSVLHKRIILGPVLDVGLTPESRDLRVYAHCARTDGGYDFPAGSVVLYYVNLLDHDVELSLGDHDGGDLDLFLLTMMSMEKEFEEEAFRSIEMYLNGNLLIMDGDDLPDMPPASGSGPITVEARGHGFVVVKDANAAICM